MIEFLSAYPIGGTDVHAIPTKDIGPAIGYYTRVLGFSVVSRTKESAVLQRGHAKIGLAKNGADPEQASCYFAVKGLDELYEELYGFGIEPSAIRVTEHEGKPQRIFFAKEPHGVCFCFGEKVSDE
jgi:catechol 2,3-dioxygenase-like lactoylglutathione lyase family enzyme